MTELISIACGIAFVSTILMHITRKNATLVWLYAIQSFALVSVLAGVASLEHDRILMVVALLTLVIKVLLAPYYFQSIVKRSKIYFAAGTHVGIPLSLLAILVLMFFSTKLLIPFVGSISQSDFIPVLLYPIMLSGILVSLFFIVNHHDVFGEIVGILSLENWTMITGIAIGVKQALLLEVGISFDIAVWIVIAMIFVTKLHQSFGTLHISRLTHLKED